MRREGDGSLVSFDDFIMEPGVPIYAQIISYVKAAVAAGAVADGEALPSRLVLSARLGVTHAALDTVVDTRSVSDDE